MGFDGLQKITNTFIDIFFADPISFFHIQYRRKITRLKFYGADEILRLLHTTFCSEKKMVCASCDTGLFRFAPVAAILPINIAESFRGLDHGKAKLHILHFHFSYFFPGDHTLVMGNIDAMDLIVDG